jgi:hypothetical protein
MTLTQDGAQQRLIGTSAVEVFTLVREVHAAQCLVGFINSVEEL